MKGSQKWNLMRLMKLKTKKAEAKISTFTLNKDQQRCYSIKIKSVGASFANAIFR